MRYKVVYCRAVKGWCVWCITRTSEVATCSKRQSLCVGRTSSRTERGRCLITHRHTHTLTLTLLVILFSAVQCCSELLCLLGHPERGGCVDALNGGIIDCGRLPAQLAVGAMVAHHRVPQADRKGLVRLGGWVETCGEARGWWMR